MIRRLCLSLLLVLFSFPIVANDIALNPNHPDKYIVKRGDTLWDISGLFLKHPWHWPEIWQANPQVENPHLIYPGDELSLVYLNGRPVLALNRGLQTFKMSPGIRDITPEKPIPTIALSDIAPFLSKPRVVGEEVMSSAPYVVAGSEERLISGAGDIVYARGVVAEQGDGFSIFRGGEPYVDPDTNEILGYEAIYTGDATIEAPGEPATVFLKSTNREVNIGDRLLEADLDDFDLSFIPRAPDFPLEGRIISVFDGVSQVGQYQIIVVNRGERDGLASGHVLSLYKAGKTVRDVVSPTRGETVELPDEYAGEAMVFRLFDKVSYAIVMRATKAMHLYDRVSSVDPLY